MINVDTQFNQQAEQDFNVKGQILDTTVATIETREMQNITAIASDLTMRLNIPDEYKVDAKAFIERPFYVDKVVFPTSATRYSFLTSKIQFLPGDVARSNPSLLNVFKMAAYGKPDMVLNVSMAGTITHAGCVLVGVLPPMPKFPTGNPKTILNTILSSPHVFLYANEATSAILQVPWYCNTDIATTDMETTVGYVPTMDLTTTNGNYATLVFYVLNPLVPSTGSSTSLTIVVEACFKNFDLMIPTPRFTTWVSESAIASAASGLVDLATNKLKKISGDAIDGARTWFRGLTGLHNPNHPVISDRMVVNGCNFGNMIDAPQYFEKMDPFANYDRIVKEPIFGTEVDEQSLKHILAKKQCIGSFQVSNTDDVGDLKWVRPISPFQGGYLVEGAPNNTIACANNIETMHALHRAWRGTLKLHIISVMNNKQQVKLKVIKMYNPSVKALSSYPTYDSVANAPSHLLEFTAGGQEHIIELPFLCRNELCPCSDNTDFEAMFHGLYYVYVAQPLVISDSSPTSVEFNMFISASDVTFYGYQTKNLFLRNWGLFSSSLTDNDPGSFKPESGLAGSKLRVMNQPQPQIGIKHDDGCNVSENTMTRLVPVIDVRPHVRRMYRATKSEILVRGLDSSTVSISLAKYLGENPKTWTQTPIMTISRMYYGKTVGFKIRLEFDMNRRDVSSFFFAKDTKVRIFYVPQNISQLSTTRTFTAALPNLATLDQLLNDDLAIPLTYKMIPDTKSESDFVLEFVVPDTSFYKFMGGPQKFEQFSSSYNTPLLSQADFGTVYINLENRTSNELTFNMVTYVGLTDESRFGYHSMAAPLNLNKGSKSMYLGTNTDVNAQQGAELNVYTYKGGFL